jgi:hypothetical protein
LVVRLSRQSLVGRSGNGWHTSTQRYTWLRALLAETGRNAARSASRVGSRLRRLAVKKNHSIAAVVIAS